MHSDDDTGSDHDIKDDNDSNSRSYDDNNDNGSNGDNIDIIDNNNSIIVITIESKWLLLLLKVSDNDNRKW